MDTLVVENLRKEYKGFTLNDVSFTIPKGYIVGFIGENGAGKTTAIKSILNIVKRDKGSITVFGKNIDEHELEIKSNIGYVSGESFYPKRKLKDITNIFKKFYKRWDEQIYSDYITKFKLDPEKKTDELSKGMCIKYSLALALSHHAELLILDEPTSGLDPVARDQLLEVFQGIVESGEVSIFYSTHITSDLEKCADYITFIQNGSILESCSKDDLIDKYRLVNGTESSLNKVLENLISYKKNAFGFNGLIRTKDALDLDEIKYGQPTIDDIMIYYSENEVK